MHKGEREGSISQKARQVVCVFFNESGVFGIGSWEEGLVSFPVHRCGRLVTEEQDVRQAKVTGNQHVKPFSLWVGSFLVASSMDYQEVGLPPRNVWERERASEDNHRGHSLDKGAAMSCQASRHNVRS